MIVKGRDEPVVTATMDHAGILRVRVDFALYSAGWCEVTLLNEDLEFLQSGHGSIKVDSRHNLQQHEGSDGEPWSPQSHYNQS